MGGHNVRALNEYMNLLRDPDLYPDIMSAGYALKNLIKAVSYIIAIIGILSMLTFILRMAVDVFVIAGGSMMLGGGVDKGDGFIGRIKGLSSFNSGDAVPVGDPGAYLKQYGFKNLLTLAFIGLMISGYMLPLAGTVTATAGAIVTKISNINPVPYIEAFEINIGELRKKAEKESINTLMEEYNKHAGTMVSAKAAAENSQDMTPEEYEQAAVAYAKSKQAADVYAERIGEVKKQARQDVSNGDGSLTKEEKKLEKFNEHAHTDQIDRILYKQGEAAAGKGN